MDKLSTSFKTLQGEKNFYQAYDHSLSLWNEPHESLYIETSYGKTHIITTGPKDGKPIILIHGFGFGAPMWYKNVAELSKTNRVYALDVLGEFNKSTITKSFHVKKDYANWILELLDQLRIHSATFIGHSNGGWHSLNFAIHYPKRIEKLVLLAPAASFTRMTIKFPMKLLLINIIKTRFLVVDYFCKWFVAKDNKVNDYLFDQFYMGLINFNWKYKIIIPNVFSEEELRKVNMPTLLLIGDKEVIYDYRKAVNKAKQLIPQIETSIIPNAGHALFAEKADQINGEILRFLK